MKLDESCFGKKMRWLTWCNDPKYFIPFAFIPNTTPANIIGLNDRGDPEIYFQDNMWEFYEEPKKKEDQVSSSLISNHAALFKSICDEATKAIRQSKPKKRIEAAPAVYSIGDTMCQITTNFYSSEAEAKKLWPSRFIKWPADWDAEKGVWYYEYE